MALPADGAADTLERWSEGHAKADVSVRLEEGVAADDAVLRVVEALVSFIGANPAKSGEWKKKADDTLEANDG